MSQYLIDQIRGKSNIHVALRSEVARRPRRRPPDRDRHRSTARPAPPAASPAPGSSSSSAPTPRPTGSPTPWPATPRGFVLTGADMEKTGTLVRDPRPLPARDQRPRHLRLRRRALLARSSASPPPSARAAWPSPSSTSTCATPRRPPGRRASAPVPADLPPGKANAPAITLAEIRALARHTRKRSVRAAGGWAGRRERCPPSATKAPPATAQLSCETVAPAAIFRALAG